MRLTPSDSGTSILRELLSLSTRNLVEPLRVQASMVKKSAATITSRGRYRNSFQVVFAVALRCRFQTVLLKNVGDGAPRNLVAQVGQRSLDSPVAPIPVLNGPCGPLTVGSHH